jgi:hypothetical protein
MLKAARSSVVNGELLRIDDGIRSSGEIISIPGQALATPCHINILTHGLLVSVNALL